MGEFVKVAEVADVPVGKLKKVEVNGVAVILVNLDGTFYAVSDTCTHEETSLSEGEIVKGCCIECPMHGAQFDLKSGSVKALPATIPLKTFELKVENGSIFIKL